MKRSASSKAAVSCSVELLETRRLMAWSNYAQLVDQDTAATQFPTLTGQGVTVAVIDTGIDYNRPELGGGFGAGHKVIAGYDFADNDTDPMDQSGHGTSVASVIAASPYTVNGITYQGVAPDAKLVALRVGTADSISDQAFESALQWVVANAKTYNISVVNMSLGSGSYTDPRTNSSMSDEFQQLHDMGIFVVAASGNSNGSGFDPINQDGIAFPAADPNVFAVGAVDASDVITPWAQRGDELDLLAPGDNLTMVQMGGGYTTESGTSFSSPYVAGTAALIKQLDPSTKAGDIGSILMSSGASNRDGDNETGNTTGLLFSRLDIDNALTLTSKRVGKSGTLKLGKTFDTALDSNGVLHAAYYDTKNGNLLYATRDIDGLWSSSQIIDSAGDVGAQMSIAVDASGKVGIGYFDSTNTAIKYASFDGSTWATRTLESNKHVGTSPSLGFDIDGNAYLAYYRRTSGDLRMATLNRDANTWKFVMVDGVTDNADVGAVTSLDVAEAAVPTQGGFTVYDTMVAIGYSDKTNGDLKYARLDVDVSGATWNIAVVDNQKGIGAIDLRLHDGFLNLGTQAQIAYQVAGSQDVKYAYKNQTWFTETVRTNGDLGASLALSFDTDDNPIITFYNDTRHAFYSSPRSSSGTWGLQLQASAASIMSLSENRRTGETDFSFLNKPRTDVNTIELV